MMKWLAVKFTELLYFIEIKSKSQLDCETAISCTFFTTNIEIAHNKRMQNINEYALVPRFQKKRRIFLCTNRCLKLHSYYSEKLNIGLMKMLIELAPANTNASRMIS